MSAVLYQSEAAECGLACVAMILCRFGRRTDVASLRARVGSFPLGMTVRDLVEVASLAGMDARAVRIEASQIRELQLPSVLHWEMSHFVVAESVNSNGSIVISDPSRGRRTVTKELANRSFTGVAVEFAVRPDFSIKSEVANVSLWKLWRGGERIAPTLAGVLALSIFIEAIGLSAPLVLQFTTDELLPSKSIGYTLMFCVVGLVLMVCQAAGQAIRLRALETLRLNLNFKVSTGLFAHLLGLPSSFFAARHHGDLQSRFSSLDEIHRGISGAVLATIFDAIVAVMLATLLFLYSPIIGALSVLCVVAYIATRSLMHQPTLAAHEGQIVSHAKRQSFLLESLRGIDTLKSYSALHVRSSEFSNLTAEAASDEFGVSRLTNLYQAISACIISVSLVGTIGLGAWEVMSNNITLGMLFALLMYRSLFMSRMFGAFDAFMRIRMLSLHAQRVSEISSHRLDDARALPGRCSSGSMVEASELEFSYPGSRGAVLRSVSFTVPAGTSAGVVGPSGCGKTTLGKLVCGLLLPTGGNLAIGGEVVSGEDAIRRHGIAVVSQSDVLFSGTILQNIVMWESQIDIHRVKDACRNACVLDEIMRMPMGLHSPVGESGSLLSGGQKQRIFLARALYKSPAILVLDEATSHLDVPTEARVLENLAILSITRIHIAHRPQSIAACDQIIRIGGAGGQASPISDAHPETVGCLA